jgi:SAM-dependent methyltransferase
MMRNSFDRLYFASNRQDRDRPALWFYSRLVKSFFSPGIILDFGCGTGFFVRRLSRFFNVDGFDVSAYGRQTAQLLMPQARIFTAMDQIPDGIYSGITALHVLEHIEDSELVAVFSCWKSALLKGGMVLCVVPELEGRGHLLKKDKWIGFRDHSHVNLKTRERWRQLFSENGFKVLRCGTDGLWDFPYSNRRWLDLLFRAPVTVLQLLAGRLILPAGSGESAIFLLERSDSRDDLPR